MAAMSRRLPCRSSRCLGPEIRIARAARLSAVRAAGVRVLPAEVRCAPPTVRMLCAFRPDALSLTIGAFIRTVFAFQRRRARHEGLADDGGRCGAVTVVQRFGSACELNVHLHSIVLDGVYADEADGRPGFRPLPAPTTAEMHALTAKVARKVIRVLRRRGLLDETVLEDAVARGHGGHAVHARAVRRPRRRAHPAPGQEPRASPRRARAQCAGQGPGRAVSSCGRGGRRRVTTGTGRVRTRACATESSNGPVPALA